MTNQLSGKTYRVALRGLGAGRFVLLVPRFPHQHAGDLQAHVLKVPRKVKGGFRPTRTAPRIPPKQLALHLRYDGEVTLRLSTPSGSTKRRRRSSSRCATSRSTTLHDLLKRLAKLQKLGQDVVVYPDAEEFIQQRLVQERMPRARPTSAATRPSIRCAPRCSRSPLLPYQLDGVAFAAGAGRAVLADDMGLGKTIQGVGMAELLAREAEIKKVLVVCPASLKSQWRSEIHRFCDRDVQLVGGRGRRASRAIRQRMVLHGLQLRAGAARHSGRSSASPGT